MQALRIACLASVACAAALSGCMPVGDHAATREPVVYGTDDRTEVFAHPNAALRAVAESAVAVEMSASGLDESEPSNVRITYDRTLGEAKTLCAGQRFADQIEPGTCSGTLIGPQHLLTAGHCVDEPDDCDGSGVWLFGFRYAREGELAPLSADDVYRCRRVLAYRDGGGVDHAVVELDREVVGRSPVAIAPAPAAVGNEVALIGHPNGIAMKIAAGGTVTLRSDDGEALEATLDAFDGNSGSGVFDRAGELTAILTGGMTDYVDMGDCQVVNVIDPPPADDGESMTAVETALDAFCTLPGVAAPVCGCDGPCVPANRGEACTTAEALDLSIGDIALTTTLTDFLDDHEGSCGGTGPDRVYAFTVDEPGRFTAQTGGTDTVVYLRAGCAGRELACNDDIDVDTNRGSFVEANLGPGSYALFIDAYDADAADLTLHVTFEVDAPATDAGADAPDGGALTTADGGTTSSDGGVAVEPGGGGCGCATVGSRTAASPVAYGLLVLALALRRRRRP